MVTSMTPAVTPPQQRLFTGCYPEGQVSAPRAQPVEHTSSDTVGTAALALVLLGTVTLLAGLVLAARSIMISQDAIDYEVARALSLGS